MNGDAETRLRRALETRSLDALVCALPIDVLLLTGYWPIMGNTVAIFTADRQVELVVPSDEEEYAKESSPAHVTTYMPGSLKAIIDPAAALADAVAARLAALGLERARIGCEMRQEVQPACYLTMYVYHDVLADRLRAAMPELTMVAADDLLAEARAIKDEAALSKLQSGCAIAGAAFRAGVAAIVPGATEHSIAGAFSMEHRTASIGKSVRRAEAFFFCMSGPNAGRADAAYARTRHRTLAEGDVAMVHCNSAYDGWWTDITRTFVAGEEQPAYRKVKEAIANAREAALLAIRPGAMARDVDRAARAVMERTGYGSNFTHATGHGVGFAAANGNGLPRIHPCSEHRLEEGMTFNIEPAAYFKGQWGMRHCDVVAVGAQGAEVLTDF